MADSDEDENYVTIGTPLPEIDEDEALPKPVKYQEQTVKDARGRPQRFHGAFTGGFSAGYFNTVATPEGFEPSRFVSSRNKKAEQVQQQHPEDFMDDEDLGEHGIAPRKISTTTKFEAQTTATKRHVYKAPKGGLLSSEVLANLITPASLPMGVKLLRKMGWKDGQGIGPRQVKRKKKKPAKKDDGGPKVYGCALPTAQSDGESGQSSDDDIQGITFAPKDVAPITFKAKDNVHGIGYSGINPHSAFSQGQGHFSLFDEPDVPTLKGKKKGMRGHAFGVGALNDDDDDIYAQDNLTKYSFEINDEDPKDSNYGWTAPRRHSTDKQGASKIIEGFKVTKQTRFSKKTYPPPLLPRGFKPFHRPKPAPVLSQIIGTPAKKEKERHDASTRSEILGEAPEFKSVFDLVPEAEKKKMDALKPTNVPQKNKRWDRKEPLPSEMSQKNESPAQNTPVDITGASTNQKDGSKAADESQSSSHQTPQANQSSANQKQDNSTTNQSESTSQQTTKSVEEMRKQNTPLFRPATFTPSSGFKPFEKFPEKQLRYEAFLEAKKKGVPYIFDVNVALTEWEKVNEQEEFSRAAQLYTRVNSVMAARFTHGLQGEVDPNVTKSAEEMEVDRSDQDKAAEMKMFGKLTREVVEWHPHKNLCKHFNVPNPYPDSTIVGLKTIKRDKYSLYNFLHVPEEPELPSPPPKEPQKALPAPPGKGKPEKKKSIFTEETLAKVNQKISFKIGVDQKNNEEEKEDSAQPEEKETGETSIAEEKEEQGEEEEEAEERPPMDLFRAIFSGSESSSDSDTSDDESNENQRKNEQSNEKSSENDTINPTQSLTGTQMSGVKAVNDNTVSSMSSSHNVSQNVPQLNIRKDLRNDDTEENNNDSYTSQNFPKQTNVKMDDTLEKGSHCPISALISDIRMKTDNVSSQNESDVSYGPSLLQESYGPALPPSFNTPSAVRDNRTMLSEDDDSKMSSSRDDRKMSHIPKQDRKTSSKEEKKASSSRSGRSKHKSEKKKSHKERKKSKHRKEKKKKSKHKRSSSKQKDKKKRKESSSSSSDESDSDDSNEDVDEMQLLARLKNFAR